MYLIVKYVYIFMKGFVGMDTLKKLFPFSFGAADVAALVIKILIYFVAGAVIGFVLYLLAHIPVVNILVGLVGALVEIYLLGGIVIAILDYLKVLK